MKCTSCGGPGPFKPRRDSFTGLHRQCRNCLNSKAGAWAKAKTKPESRRGKDKIPDINISETAKAWAAGLFDGEGCVYIQRNNPRASIGAISPSYKLLIKVTMTHHETLVRLRDIFKMGVVSTSRQATERHAAQYSWVCTTNQAAAIVSLISPY